MIGIPAMNYTDPLGNQGNPNAFANGVMQQTADVAKMGQFQQQQIEEQQLKDATVKQNALSFPGEPQASYQDIQAQQAQAKLINDTYSNYLTQGIASQNSGMTKAVAQKYRESNNPMLVKLADMVDSIKFVGKDEWAMAIDFDEPKAKESFYNKYKAQLGELGITSPEMIADGRYDVKYKGDAATGNFHPVEFKRVDKDFNPLQEKRIVKSEIWKKSDGGDDKYHDIVYDNNGNLIKRLGISKEEKITANQRGMKGYIQHKSIPGAFFNREDGKTYVDVPDENGVTKRVAMDTLSVQEQAKYWTPTMKKLQQQGGTQAVTAYVTANTYKSEAEELLKMQSTLQKLDKDKLLTFKGQFKNLNQLSQWIEMSTADNPQLAEYLKGTKLLADLLQKAVGGAQGGQWAFELATTLLDPSLPPNAYRAAIRKHERTLDKKAAEYSGVGDTPGKAGYKPQPKLPTQKKAPDTAVFVGYDERKGGIKGGPKAMVYYDAATETYYSDDGKILKKGK